MHFEFTMCIFFLHISQKSYTFAAQNKFVHTTFSIIYESFAILLKINLNTII